MYQSIGLDFAYTIPPNLQVLLKDYGPLNRKKRFWAAQQLFMLLIESSDLSCRKLDFGVILVRVILNTGYMSTLLLSRIILLLAFPVLDFRLKGEAGVIASCAYTFIRPDTISNKLL